MDDAQTEHELCLEDAVCVNDVHFENSGVNGLRVSTDEAGGQDEKCGNRGSKTAFLVMAFLGYGMIAMIPGPTLLDLQFQVRCTFEKISIVLVVFSAGHLVGTIAGGFWFDHFDSHLLLALAMLGLAVVGAFIPWCPMWGILILNFVLLGCMTGCFETGGNAYCVNLWGKESGPYLQAIHFVFAIGAAVAPLIAAPFLMPQQSFVSTTLNESSTISPTDLPFLTNSTFPYRSQYDISCAHCDIGANDVIPVHESNNSFFSTEGNNTLQLAPSLQIWIPYTILSLYNLLVSLPFFCLFVIEGRRVNLPEKERENASDPHNVVFVEKNQKYFVFILLILLGAFVFVYFGHETIYANFLYTFAISSGLGFTPELAAYLNAAYWGSIAGFRFLSIFCATKVTPKTLLTVASIGMSLSSAALALFGNDVAEVLWAATVLLGASVASVLPACISWTEGYIKLTGKVMAVITGSAACADISLPWLMGHLFSVFGMGILMYTMLAVSLATAVIYFGMQVFATKYGNRFGDETSQKTSNV